MDLDVLERRLHGVFAAGPREEVRLGAREVDVRRHDVGLGELVDRLADGDAADQHVVDRHVERIGIESERVAERRLRIEVHEQDARARFRDRSTEGNGRGCLGDAALLIGDRDGTSHYFPLPSACGPANTPPTSNTMQPAAGDSGVRVGKPSAGLLLQARKALACSA